MVKILICDDDQTFAQSMFKRILSLPAYSSKSMKLSCLTDIAEMSADTIAQYDILFLDIDLGKESGIDLARKMRKMNPEAVLIFVTNFSEYAPEGYAVARIERPLLLRILFLRYFLSEFPQKTFENGAQDAVQLVGDPVVTRAYDLCHFGDVVELVADVLNGRTYRNQIDDQGDQGENTAQNQRSPDHRAGQLCEPDDEGP